MRIFTSTTTSWSTVTATDLVSLIVTEDETATHTEAVTVATTVDLYSVATEDSTIWQTATVAQDVTTSIPVTATSDITTTETDLVTTDITVSDTATQTTDITVTATASTTTTATATATVDTTVVSTITSTATITDTVTAPTTLQTTVTDSTVITNTAQITSVVDVTVTSTTSTTTTTTVTATATASCNLITNPDFDDSVTGWTVTNSPTSSYSFVTGDGTPYALKLTASGSSSIRVVQTLPTVSGAEYDLQFNYQAISSAETTEQYLYYGFGASQGVVKFSTITLNQWNTISTTFTATSSSTVVFLELLSLAGAPSVYLDSVVIREASLSSVCA